MRAIGMCGWVAAMAVALSSQNMAGDAGGPTPPTVVSAKIDVTGIPANAQYITISAPIELSVSKGHSIGGLVDLRSIRLFESGESGVATEVPAQFTPAPLPRLKGATLLPGTSPAVSYRQERSADDATPAPLIKGTLAWIVGPGKTSRAYRLTAAIPHEGRTIQTPFAPAELRVFDAEGRASAVSQFPLMQMHPLWPFEGVIHMGRVTWPITTYHVGPTTAPSGDAIRRPFFYPVVGPDNIPLTEFGKPHDPTGSHRHHYSLWITHHDVAGKDFWSDAGGVILNEQLAEQEDGPVFCRIVQKAKWQFEGKDLMRERRTLTVYNPPEGFRLIDVAMELTPAGKEPVTLGKTTFGFLSVRVAESMTVFDGGGEIMTSAGNRNESKAHLSHGDWIDLAGPIAPGKWGGVALMDDPGNPNHPTGFHCRNDGWACASFNIDAPWTIEPGKPLRLNYRVLLHRGDSIKGEVARRYSEFAARPFVEVGPLEEQARAER